ncbi:DUF4386 family protein [Stenotrophomonas indicatrix]|uniref:DUF4386 family protein n=1 Tax=Stenotrophomonas indicatrix TaxID=2045451 RepID=UPI003CCCD4B4
MATERAISRSAGAVYLLVVVTGIFSLGYVPRQLRVGADPQAMLGNLVAHRQLFQWGCRFPGRADRLPVIPEPVPSAAAHASRHSGGRGVTFALGLVPRLAGRWPSSTRFTNHPVAAKRALPAHVQQVPTDVGSE